MLSRDFWGDKKRDHLEQHATNNTSHVINKYDLYQTLGIYYLVDDYGMCSIVLLDISDISTQIYYFLKNKN